MQYRSPRVSCYHRPRSSPSTPSIRGSLCRAPDPESWLLNDEWPAELAALHAHLGETFTSYEGARHWIRSPLTYLSGLTPVQVLQAGDSPQLASVDLLEAALEALDSGVFL